MAQGREAAMPGGGTEAPLAAATAARLAGIAVAARAAGGMVTALPHPMRSSLSRSMMPFSSSLAFCADSRVCNHQQHRQSMKSIQDPESLVGNTSRHHHQMSESQCHHRFLVSKSCLSQCHACHGSCKSPDKPSAIMRRRCSLVSSLKVHENARISLPFEQKDAE